MDYFDSYRKQLKKEEQDIQNRLKKVNEDERIYKEKSKLEKEKKEKLQKLQKEELENELKNDTENIMISINYDIEHCGSCCGDSDSDHINDEEHVTVNLIEMLSYLKYWNSPYSKNLIKNITKEDFFKNTIMYIQYFLQRYYSRPSNLHSASYKIFKDDDLIGSGGI